ncbi:MAG: DUF86 domain-containing protein [Chloroflexi bacterium]|nr:DUF86 domain-containing protein [Chloroflexota bacterium]
MTSLAAIEKDISSIRRYLKILRGYQAHTREAIENDITLRGAVERYLYLVTQATIDVAEAIIAFKNFRRPGTYADAFHILKEEGFLSAALTDKLVKMVGFRNVIAHDYSSLDFRIVHDVMMHGLDDIEAFLGETKERLAL